MKETYIVPEFLFTEIKEEDICTESCLADVNPHIGVCTNLAVDLEL